jgi:hypothetical protein
VIQDLAVLRGKGSSGQRDSIIIAVRCVGRVYACVCGGGTCNEHARLRRRHTMCPPLAVMLRWHVLPACSHKCPPSTPAGTPSCRWWTGMTGSTAYATTACTGMRTPPSRRAAQAAPGGRQVRRTEMMHLSHTRQLAAQAPHARLLVRCTAPQLSPATHTRLLLHAPVHAHTPRAHAVNTLVTVPPRVAADPAGRCAAALLYGRQLAILPAFQADVLELLVQQVRDGPPVVICERIGGHRVQVRGARQACCKRQLHSGACTPTPDTAPACCHPPPPPTMHRRAARRARRSCATQPVSATATPSTSVG